MKKRFAGAKASAAVESMVLAFHASKGRFFSSFWLVNIFSFFALLLRNFVKLRLYAEHLLNVQTDKSFSKGGRMTISFADGTRIEVAASAFNDFIQHDLKWVEFVHGRASAEQEIPRNPFPQSADTLGKNVHRCPAHTC